MIANETAILLNIYMCVCGVCVCVCIHVYIATDLEDYYNCVSFYHDILSYLYCRLSGAENKIVYYLLKGVEN